MIDGRLMRVYFDHNATTPVDASAADAMMRVLRRFGKRLERAPNGNRTKPHRRRPHRSSSFRRRAVRTCITQRLHEGRNLPPRRSEAIVRRRSTSSHAMKRGGAGALKASPRGWRDQTPPGRRIGSSAGRARGRHYDIPPLSGDHSEQRARTLKPVAIFAGCHARGALFHTEDGCSRSRGVRSMRAPRAKLLALSRTSQGPRRRACGLKSGTRIAPISRRKHEAPGAPARRMSRHCRPCVAATIAGRMTAVRQASAPCENLEREIQAVCPARSSTAPA